MVLHCDLKNKTKIGQMIKLCRELRERSADADIFQMNNQKFKKNKANIYSTWNRPIFASHFLNVSQDGMVSFINLCYIITPSFKNDTKQ